MKMYYELAQKTTVAPIQQYFVSGAFSQKMDADTLFFFVLLISRKCVITIVPSHARLVGKLMPFKNNFSQIMDLTFDVQVQYEFSSIAVFQIFIRTK